MAEIYGPWMVKFTLPGAFKGADELRFNDIPQETGSYRYRFQVGRLLYWGIVPPRKFNAASRSDVWRVYGNPYETHGV